MQRQRQHPLSTLFDIGNVTVMVLSMAVFVYPMLYVFSVSISAPVPVALEKVWLLPMGLDLKAYGVVLRDGLILSAYRNTIVYSVLYTALTLLLTSMLAYPLTTKELVGKKPITFFIILTLFINGGLIPFYLLVSSLHLVNTMFSIILPGAVSAWNLILIRTNFGMLPYELRDSAAIDGAGHWRMLFMIIIPLSKPILATIALFSMVSQWNNFFEPMIFLNSEGKWPLQLVLRRLIIQNQATGSQMMQQLDIMANDQSSMGLAQTGFYESLRMAAIIVSIGPIILIYPFLQRYFIKGMLVGSIKS